MKWWSAGPSSGMTFYGCNRYPDCKFVTSGKPVAEKCPECGSPYMIEKRLKTGSFLAVSGVQT